MEWNGVDHSDDDGCGLRKADVLDLCTADAANHQTKADHEDLAVLSGKIPETGGHPGIPLAIWDRIRQHHPNTYTFS